MSGALAARIDTSHVQRSVRWALQAVLLLVTAHLALVFLLSAVVPLALDTPLRWLAAPRERLLGRAARIVCVVVVGIQSAYLSAGIAAMTASMLAAALQTLLVFAAAYVVSRTLTASAPR